MDQWDKTAAAIVQARYDDGPEATASGIAHALRTLSDELIRAGVETAAELAQAERKSCIAMARELAARGWGTAPLNALANAIEDRKLMHRTD